MALRVPGRADAGIFGDPRPHSARGYEGYAGYAAPSAMTVQSARAATGSAYTSSIDLGGGGGYEQQGNATSARRANNALGMNANQGSLDLFGGGYEANSNPYEGQRTTLAGQHGKGMQHSIDLFGGYNVNSNPYEGQRSVVGAHGNGNQHSIDLAGGYNVNSNPYDGQRSVVGAHGNGNQHSIDIFGGYMDRFNPNDTTRSAVRTNPAAAAQSTISLSGGYDGPFTNPYEGQRSAVRTHAAQAAASSIDLGGGGGYAERGNQTMHANNSLNRHANDSSVADIFGGYAEGEYNAPRPRNALGMTATSTSNQMDKSILGSLNNAHDLLLGGGAAEIDARHMNRGNHGHFAAESSLDLGGDYPEPLAVGVTNSRLKPRH
jgi:hypothetical protein